jgi:hypothetical protein
LSTLAEIMTQIETIEVGLSITSPFALGPDDIRVYKIVPSQRNLLSEKVNFMNWPDAAPESPRMGNFREDDFTVQIDCLIREGDLDKGALIARAFFDAAWNAFDAQRPAAQRLNGTVDLIELRAERPMVEVIEWGKLGYAGFHLFLDMQAFTEVTPL